MVEDSGEGQWWLNKTKGTEERNDDNMWKGLKTLSASLSLLDKRGVVIETCATLSQWTTLFNKRDFAGYLRSLCRSCEHGLR